MSKLNIGDKAPDFKLSDQNGNTVSLADFTGKKLLIFFYPKASTPGCTTQACNVSQAAPELNGLNVAAVGMSPDAPDKQKKFDEKNALGFPLLADEDHAIAEAFGVWGEKSLYGKKYMGIIRSSFLISETGLIEQAWYKVSPANTVPFALKALK